MPIKLEINFMNNMFSTTSLNRFKATCFPKTDNKQRESKDTDISLASWLIRCSKIIFKSKDILQHTDPAAVRSAYMEAAKYF